MIHLSTTWFKYLSVNMSQVYNLQRLRYTSRCQWLYFKQLQKTNINIILRQIILERFHNNEKIFWKIHAIMKLPKCWYNDFTLFWLRIRLFIVNLFWSWYHCSHDQMIFMYVDIHFGCDWNQSLFQSKSKSFLNKEIYCAKLSFSWKQIKENRNLENIWNVKGNIKAPTL